MSNARGLVVSILLSGAVRASSVCSLCRDHAIPNDAMLHEQNGVKCRDLFDQLEEAEEDSTECRHIQLAAFQTGCCNEQYIPEDVCSVCPDGSSFDSGVVIPGSVGRRALTCGDLTTEASFLDFFTTPGECGDTFVQRSAAWCQCPGHQVECHLCPGGSLPPDLSKTEKVIYGWNCESFQYVTALLTHGECAVAAEVLEFDAAAFCCPGLERPEVCSFCPDGEVVLDGDKVVSTGYGAVSCGDIEESLSLVPTEESCEFVHKSFNSDLCCGNPVGSAGAALRGEKMFAYGVFIAAFFML